LSQAQLLVPLKGDEMKGLFDVELTSKDVCLSSLLIEPV